MKSGERFAIGLMCLWGLFAVHQGVNALVRAHNWQPMTVSDWGTWVGSIGTVATLAGTIHLARQETRRRHRQEHDAAVVAAAFMDLPLIGYVRILRHVIGELKKPVQDDFSNPWAECACDLGNCPIWTREDVQPLLYLGNGVAADLAIAQDYVKNSRERLETTAGQRVDLTIELYELSEFNEEVVAVLEEALVRVNRAFGRCSDLLDEARVV
jgi:hypothetical protein